jgi:hypothetical protein
VSELDEDEVQLVMPTIQWFGTRAAQKCSAAVPAPTRSTLHGYAMPWPHIPRASLPRRPAGKVNGRALYLSADITVSVRKRLGERLRRISAWDAAGQIYVERS